MMVMYQLIRAIRIKHHKNPNKAVHHEKYFHVGRKPGDLRKDNRNADKFTLVYITKKNNVTRGVM
jgi:hypothetical protein